MKISNENFFLFLTNKGLLTKEDFTGEMDTNRNQSISENEFVSWLVTNDKGNIDGMNHTVGEYKDVFCRFNSQKKGFVNGTDNCYEKFELNDVELEKNIEDSKLFKKIQIIDTAVDSYLANKPVNILSLCNIENVGTVYVDSLQVDFSKIISQGAFQRYMVQYLSANWDGSVTQQVSGTPDEVVAGSGNNRGSIDGIPESLLDEAAAAVTREIEEVIVQAVYENLQGWWKTNYIGSDYNPLEDSELFKAIEQMIDDACNPELGKLNGDFLNALASMITGYFNGAGLYEKNSLACNDNNQYTYETPEVDFSKPENFDRFQKLKCENKINYEIREHIDDNVKNFYNNHTDLFLNSDFSDKIFEELCSKYCEDTATSNSAFVGDFINWLSIDKIKDTDAWKNVETAMEMADEFDGIKLYNAADETVSENISKYLGIGLFGSLGSEELTALAQIFDENFKNDDPAIKEVVNTILEEIMNGEYPLNDDGTIPYDDICSRYVELLLKTDYMKNILKDDDKCNCEVLALYADYASESLSKIDDDNTGAQKLTRMKNEAKHFCDEVMKRYSEGYSEIEDAIKGACNGSIDYKSYIDDKIEDINTLNDFMQSILIVVREIIGEEICGNEGTGGLDGFFFGGENGSTTTDIPGWDACYPQSVINASSDGIYRRNFNFEIIGKSLVKNIVRQMSTYLKRYLPNASCTFAFAIITNDISPKYGITFYDDYFEINLEELYNSFLALANNYQ